MSKTILVCGFGVGISHAVAHKFGKEGYSVALIARSADKLAAGVEELKAKGIKASGYAADLSDFGAVKATVAKAQKDLGPIAAIHWNAYAGIAPNLLEADAAAIHAAIDVAVTGLLAAVQASHADLKANKGLVLVTNGGLANLDAGIDAMAVSWGAMGLALAGAAKAKAVGLLAAKLKDDGIYVGQVKVLGQVKGTPWDQGQATLTASTVAEKFWSIAQARSETYVDVQ